MRSRSRSRVQGARPPASKGAGSDAVGPLHVVDVVKKYGDGEEFAVRGVNFQLHQGEFLTLLGPSGSGKTTILNIVAGFVSPTTGDVVVGGQSVLDLAPRFRNLGIVFQSYALFPYLTALENVEFGLRMRGVPRQVRRREAQAMLEVVGIDDLSSRRPSEMSGGQQQRVALARALVIQPTVLLLDEPLGALDRRLRQRVAVEIKGIQRDGEISVLYVTHDQEEAMVMSDRLAVMRGGRIEQVGTPEEVYSRPATEFVANFLGEANLFGVTVTDTERDHALCTYLDGSRGVVECSPEAMSGPALVCVRPENVKLLGKDDHVENSFSGIVSERIFLGSSTQLSLRVMGQDVSVTVSGTGQSLPEPGDSVVVGWMSGDSHLIILDPSASGES